VADAHWAIERRDVTAYFPRMDYRSIITIEPDKRGGRPCIRGMRITVYDILGWLAAGMSCEEIIEEFPELTKADITAALTFAASRDGDFTGTAA
jgi:uncharacterized protein (DUF433 family)